MTDGSRGDDPRRDKEEMSGGEDDGQPRLSAAGRSSFSTTWLRSPQNGEDGRTEFFKDSLNETVERRGWEGNRVNNDDAYSTEFNVEFEPRKHKFNIIDFHTPYHEANLQALYPRSVKEERFRYVSIFIIAIIVGIFVAAAGWMIETGVRWVTKAVYSVAQVTLIDSGQFAVGLVAYALLALLLASVSSFMVVFISPLAAGSGIPEIKSYLNGVLLPGLVKFKTLIVKGSGVCLSISSGLICGKEGPMIHSGGIIGSGVAVAASGLLRGRIPYKWWDYFRTEEWKRDFTACGAAAGVAVAFQAPLGGVLFVIEEAATHWSQKMSWATLLAASLSAIIGSSFEEIAHGHLNLNMSEYGFLSGVMSNSPFFLKDIGFFILIGICGGVFGGVLTLIQKPLTLFRFKHINRPWRRLLEAMTISLLTSGLRIMVPSINSMCVTKDQAYIDALAEKDGKDYTRFDCEKDEYNPLASLVWVPMDVVISNLMHNSNNYTWSVWMLFVALAFFVSLTIITYGIAVPSGLFIPAYVVGALIGRIVGLLALASFPDSRDDFYMSSYVFIGAVAGLAGATRMTMSVVMIAAETSSFGTGMLPGFIVALVAKFVGDSMSEGIYDLHIILKGIPILEPRIREETDKYYSLRCRDVMEKHIAAIYDVSTVADLIHVLQTFQYGTFPVVCKYNEPIDLLEPVDEARTIKHDPRFPPKVMKEPPGLMDFSKVQFKGMINRYTIISVLKHYASLVQDDEGGFKVLPRNRYDIAYPNTLLLRREKQILREIPADLMNATVDLNPYVDRNPPTISDKATVAEVNQGERKEPLGGKQSGTSNGSSSRIVGILTRKDVLPETVEDVHEGLSLLNDADLEFVAPKASVGNPQKEE